MARPGIVFGGRAVFSKGQENVMLLTLVRKLRNTLVFKLIFAVGLTLLVSIAVWAYFNIRYEDKMLTQQMLSETARFGNTIKLGTHYAMMNNARDDINQIITNIARQEDVETIRIYNKAGQIKFSNLLEEVDQSTNIKAEACDVCHHWDPPLEMLTPSRARAIFERPAGQSVIGVITPILNEPRCSEACHVHPVDKKVLGALDVVFSLEKVQAEMLRFKDGIIMLAAFVFLVTSAIIVVVMLRFVNRPIRRLIDETRLIAEGDYITKVPVDGEDEINQLAMAVNRMGDEIARSQMDLRRQRNEYQNLFENVPCEIAVLDRDFRLVNFQSQLRRQIQSGQRGTIVTRPTRAVRPNAMSAWWKKPSKVPGRSWEKKRAAIRMDGPSIGWWSPRL
jgi:histidine kinase